MHIRRILVLAAGGALAAASFAAVPAAATATPAAPVIASPNVNLSRPLIRMGGGKAPASTTNGIPAVYSGNWSGYAALPKTSGAKFTSIVGNYTVPSVDCTATPNTFSYHWIGLDGWSDATVEQDGIAADCNGTTPFYAAWYEMYPSPLLFNFRVNPGDAIESAVFLLANGKYELTLKDVSTGQGFDVSRACTVACASSSAEAITEAYYYNKRYSGTSAFGDEHYANVTVTDSNGGYGGLVSSAWKTGESIALGEFGDVDTTPGPLATANAGFTRSSSFSVFWSRKN